MGITCQPGYPGLSTLLRPAAHAGILDANDRTTALGRDAIYWAFRGMGYPRGTTAWLPSFHCGVEVEAVIDAGFSVAYYGIGADLVVNQEDLHQGLRARPGPVLLIHCFGFPQPQTSEVLELCSAHRVPLVEDCCHALFSHHGNVALGSIGQVAAFSVRKSLGTVDGGFLRVNARRFAELTGLPFERPPNGPRAGWPYGALAQRTLHAHLGTMPSRLDRWLCAGVPDPDLCSGGRAAPARRHTRSSRLAERVLLTARPTEIVQQRRANWELLRSAVSQRGDLQPVHGELAQGVCPLGFVVRTSGRAELAEALTAGGVEPYVFGAKAHPTLPLAQFPATERLRQELLCLPVHQALGPTQIERMVALLDGAPGTHGPVAG